MATRVSSKFVAGTATNGEPRRASTSSETVDVGRAATTATGARSPVRRFDSESDMPDCVPKGEHECSRQNESPPDSFQKLICCKTTQARTQTRWSFVAANLLVLQKKNTALFYLALAEANSKGNNITIVLIWQGGNLGSFRIIGAEQQLRYAWSKKSKLQTNAASLRIVTEKWVSQRRFAVLRKLADLPPEPITP